MSDAFAATPVKGAHSRGDAVSPSDILAVLAVVANATAPTYSEGTEQSLSTDLSGNLRVLLGTGSTTQINVGGTAVAVGAPFPVGLEVAGAAVAAGNPVPVNLEVAGAAVAPGNPVPVNLEQGGAVVSATNAEFVQPGTGATFPVKGTHTTNAAAPAADLVGVLAAIANAAAPAYTEADGVLLSTDLSGNLRVAVTASTAMTVQGNKTGNAASPDGLGVEVYPAVATAAGPTYTAGDLVALSTDLAGRLRALIDSTSAPSLTANGGVVATANPLPVGLEVAGAAVAAGNPVPVGLEVAGAAVAPGNPVPVNVEIGGAVNSATNPIFDAPVVRGAVVSDINPLPVLIQDNPGTLYDVPYTFASLAAGASHTFVDSTIAASVTGKLIEVTASASVRIKVEIQTYISSTATDRRVLFAQEATQVQYAPKDVDQITVATGGHFQVIITNLDNINAADVYCSIAHIEV